MFKSITKKINHYLKVLINFQEAQQKEEQGVRQREPVAAPSHNQRLEEEK
jgi:hypothetical protein